jgi:fumarate reductase flavoprotein subunit
MNPKTPRGTGIEGSIIRAGAIIVNKIGKRYVNEINSIGDKETLKQPDKVGFVVFDSKAATTDIVPTGAPTGKGPWICTGRFLEDWKKIPDAVKQADTIEELAKKMGVDPAGLKETVDKYNAFVAAGKDTDFGRGNLVAIKQPPFYGLGPGRPMITTSSGTLMVNAKHQVLDVFGEVIPKLYAAGDMGKSGKVSGHGTHLAWAVISGRRSGKNAAGEKPWDAAA